MGFLFNRHLQVFGVFSVDLAENAKLSTSEKQNIFHVFKCRFHENPVPHVTSVKFLICLGSSAQVHI